MNASVGTCRQSTPRASYAARTSIWADMVMQILVLLETWEQRRTQRRQLAELDDRLLHDIGRSRAEVEAETAKPFWIA